MACGIKVHIMNSYALFFICLYRLASWHFGQGQLKSFSPKPFRSDAVQLYSGFVKKPLVIWTLTLLPGRTWPVFGALHLRSWPCLGAFPGPFRSWPFHGWPCRVPGRSERSSGRAVPFPFLTSPLSRRLPSAHLRFHLAGSMAATSFPERSFPLSRRSPALSQGTERIWTHTGNGTLAIVPFVCRSGAFQALSILSNAVLGPPDRFRAFRRKGKCHFGHLVQREQVFAADNTPYGKHYWHTSSIPMNQLSSKVSMWQLARGGRGHSVHSTVWPMGTGPVLTLDWRSTMHTLSKIPRANCAFYKKFWGIVCEMVVRGEESLYESSLYGSLFRM